MEEHLMGNMKSKLTNNIKLGLRLKALLLVLLAIGTTAAFAQPSEPGKKRDRGEGPYDRLIIRGVNIIDGTGGPVSGPKDVVIEGNKIVSIHGVGYPGVPMSDRGRPSGATKEIDATGMYLMPGFIDLHVHTGGQPKVPNADYVYKLWLAHGVTTVRGVPFSSVDWSLSEKERSAKNEIAAPRMVSYHRIGSSGKGWKGGDMSNPETVREWVRWANKVGIDGLKLGAHDPEIMEAALDEANKLGMGTTAHLDQAGVVRMNTLDAARLGLGAQTHYYGLFESLYEGHDVQPYPIDHNYMNEQHRFGQVARQWNKIVEPGSERWNAMIEELIALDFTMDPTMTIYEASRDVMRARNKDWHRDYTLPTLWDFYKPSRRAHGSYWFYWTTQDEIEWKRFYSTWMQFLNDYKNAGGRVTTGSDSGFIYNTYGFGYIREFELLQEAGFHPLEVIRSATLYGAEELVKASGGTIDRGIIRPGKLADLVIVEENPLENFKSLYGNGAIRLKGVNEIERVGGVKYTIKDGIIYDAKQLLEDVRKMVDEQENKLGKKDMY